MIADPFYESRSTLSRLLLASWEVDSPSAILCTTWFLFTRGSIPGLQHYAEAFLTVLEDRMSRPGVGWQEQSIYTASFLIAAILDFGAEDIFLWSLIRDPNRLYEQNLVQGGMLPVNNEHRKELGDSTSKLGTSANVTMHAIRLWSRATTIFATRPGDNNTLPFMHVTLAFL